jgi:hypothetical protein
LHPSAASAMSIISPGVFDVIGGGYQTRYVPCDSTPPKR